MESMLDVKTAINDHFEKSKIDEFAFFCIARQGGRTALEILARAFISEGNYAYIGQSLTGLRSMGTNSFVAKFSAKPDIPPGINVMRPKGIMFMHEALFWPDYVSFLGEGQLKRTEVVLQQREGTLMVCTARPPEELEYPVDFQGTVATVDAEGIFLERVGISPPPSGITSLGLFVAATNIVSLESVKEATMMHDRLSKRVREMNVGCIVEAYEKAKVSHNIKLKGKVSLQQYAEMTNRKASSEILTAKEKGVSTMWREMLPTCDVSKCVCIECLAAYFCPEGAISWKDEQIQVDYDFCKGCGTCAMECPEHAVKLEDEHIVLAH